MVFHGHLNTNPNSNKWQKTRSQHKVKLIKSSNVNTGLINMLLLRVCSSKIYVCISLKMSAQNNKPPLRKKNLGSFVKSRFGGLFFRRFGSYTSPSGKLFNCQNLAASFFSPTLRIPSPPSRIQLVWGPFKPKPPAIHRRFIHPCHLEGPSPRILKGTKKNIPRDWPSFSWRF